jgi:hypothetical protein
MEETKAVSGQCGEAEDVDNEEEAKTTRWQDPSSITIIPISDPI